MNIVDKLVILFFLLFALGCNDIYHGEVTHEGIVIDKYMAGIQRNIPTIVISSDKIVVFQSWEIYYQSEIGEEIYIICTNRGGHKTQTYGWIDDISRINPRIIKWGKK
jgi:hypothetical protein